MDRLYYIVVMESAGPYTSLDNLIMCCQPLYDARISELRSELEDYKLRVFWAKHSNKRLKKLIIEHGNKINCPCLACLYSHRSHIYIDEDQMSAECIWQPVFEKIASECGLTVAPGEPKEPPLFMDTLHNVSSAEAHLGSGIRGDWVHGVGIGTLLQTKSWEEIRKYEHFIQRIWKVIDPNTTDDEHNNVLDYLSDGTDDNPDDSDDSDDIGSDIDSDDSYGNENFLSTKEDLALLHLFIDGSVTGEQINNVLKIYNVDTEIAFRTFLDKIKGIFGDEDIILVNDDGSMDIKRDALDYLIFNSFLTIEEEILVDEESEESEEAGSDNSEDEYTENS